MTRLNLRKVRGKGGRIGFVPADNAAEIEAEKFPMGRRLKAEITTPRSLPFNGLMFQAFTLIAKALNAGPTHREWDQNSVRKRLLIMTGNADMYELPEAVKQAYGLPEGVRVVGFEPCSMAFDSMTEDEASRFYEGASKYLLTEFGDYLEETPEWREVDRIINRVPA